MKLIETANYQELSRIAGEIILKQLEQKRDSVLGLATGSTPVGVYQYLAQAHRDGLASFANVKSVNLDEYVGLDPEHPNSYHSFMWNELFNHIDIEKCNCYLPKGKLVDLDAECENYEAVIRQLGGIDLQVLGIGVNGHIGFNEPGTSFSTKTHVVELTQSTRDANLRFFASPDDVPTHAITMGIDTIMQSRKIVLLIAGESKAEILDRLLRGEITEEVPASILKQHSDVTLIADRDALKLYHQANHN